MENFVFAEGNTTYSAEDGILYNAKKNTLYKNILDQYDVFEVPDTVTTISSNAFESCSNLNKVIVPANVQYIYSSAFTGCKNLKEIVYLPDATIAEVFSNLFYNCTALESYICPDSVKKIGNYAFYGCTALKDVKFNKNATYIGYQTFYGCTSLEEIHVSGNIQTICGYACSVCGHVETEVIPPVEFALGDTSGDGVVDQNDYNLIVEIANGTKTPSPEELYAADINQDGTVDGFDVIYFDLILNNYI